MIALPYPLRYVLVPHGVQGLELGDVAQFEVVTRCGEVVNITGTIDVILTSTDGQTWFGLADVKRKDEG